MKTLVKSPLSESSARIDLAIPIARPSIGERELAAVGEVFESNWLGFGPAAERFATRVGEMVGARHVVPVNSGTAALHSALVALELGPGDEVIVPSMTFVSTVQAIVAVGATPVFCEVLGETLNIDVADAAQRITPQTRALLPVHYGGEPCDLDAISALAGRHGLRVVEDAAHAFGSSYRGKPVGGHGDIVCFSFDPIKNITCGLGGAVATNDDRLAEILFTATNVGIDPTSIDRSRVRSKSYAVTAAGLRYRMSDINGAIGLTQLERMEEFRRRKIQIVRRYDDAFADIPALMPLAHNLSETFPFSYVMRVRDGSRDKLMAFLADRGIGSAVQFIPNHRQPAFADGSQLPRTEQLFGEIINLPFYASLTEEEVAAVISAVRLFFA